MVNIKTVLAHGAYDSNKNFKYLLEKKKIQSAIKVKNNFIITHKNNNVRNREVQLQTKDLLKWKKKRNYGYRWMAAQTVFPSVKRMFIDEYTYAAIKF